MENASKALLIAAGVLIVILIIAMSMSIFNGTDGVTDDADKVGESISESTTDASKEAISSLKDINSKNLLNIEEHREKPVNSNHRYNDTITDVYLEPNKKYKFQFDYKVIKANDKLIYTLGRVENEQYIQTISGYLEYPKELEGTCKYEFSVQERICLGIRFARIIGSGGDFEVYISNVELREVK